jgi:predicted metalloprotease with PDZ domain
MPTRRNVRLALHEPPFDGVIGVRVLGRFDITIDNPAGEAWLAPRSKSSLRCHGTPPTTFHGTTGFRPWLYKGQAIVASLQEGSPAEAAGIKPGDSILSIDGGDVFAYYDHLDATCLAPATVKVTFRNASGDHTVVLTPAMPYQDKNGDSGSTSQPDK